MNCLVEERESIRHLHLDMIIPKKGGLEVYDEIRKMGSSVRAEFASGYPANLVPGSTRHEKGSDLLTKRSALSVY